MKESKKKIIQIIIASILLIISIIIDNIFDLPITIRTIIYLVPYLVSGYDIIIEAFENIIHGEIFDECFLMVIATVGAMCIGFLPNAEPEFLEAVFVMLFFQVGEFFEIIAEDNSEKSINTLLELKPNSANLIMDNGKVKKTTPETLRLFDIIEVRKGEKIPVDGIIIEGNTELNTSFLTGESIPRVVKVGDNVMSGCINLGDVIRIKVMKTYEDSATSKIIEMIETSNDSKSSKERFITRFAKIYTPLVVLCALLLALVPPIFDSNYVSWINRSISFLIVSCPCALVISVPLSYFGGVGAASKKGVLIKGANYLEDLSRVNTVVFDKTGTLTKGSFEVVAIHPNIINEKEILHLAMHVESYSTHPIAVSLKEAYDKYSTIKDKCKVKDVEELSGLGIKALVNDEVIYVGNDKLMETNNIKYEKCNKVGTIVHVASLNNYYGHIIVSDVLKSEALDTINSLNERNISIVMLTGDKEVVAKEVAKNLKITKYYANLMPKDKVKMVTKLQKNNNGKVVFVGDGVNDAPVLSRSDLGISMGGIGSDIAVETSNIVVMNDNLTKIVDAIDISKKTEKIVIENISFAIIVKLLTLVLSFLGLVPISFAVFADVGVTVIAILNALRTLRL